MIKKMQVQNVIILNCSSKYYNYIDNDYNFNQDNTEDYFISPSQTKLFEDISGEKYVKDGSSTDKQIKLYSETQYVYDKLVSNSNIRFSTYYIISIYDACSYVDLIITFPMYMMIELDVFIMAYNFLNLIIVQMIKI